MQRQRDPMPRVCTDHGMAAPLPVWQHSGIIADNYDRRMKTP